MQKPLGRFCLRSLWRSLAMAVFHGDDCPRWRCGQSAGYPRLSRTPDPRQVVSTGTGFERETMENFRGAGAFLAFSLLQSSGGERALHVVPVRPEPVDGLPGGVDKAGSGCRPGRQNRVASSNVPPPAATGILPRHRNAGAAGPFSALQVREPGDAADPRRETSRAFETTGSELRASAVAPKGLRKNSGVRKRWRPAARMGRLQASRLRKGAISLTLRPAWSYSWRLKPGGDLHAGTGRSAKTP